MKAWTTDLDNRLRHVRDALDPSLQPACDALFARRHLLTGDDTSYLNPLAQPVFTIAEWAADVGPLPSTTIADLTESSVWGYLLVRIHDDAMDEGIGESSHNLLLAHQFSVRHHRLLAAHVQSPSFWQHYDRLWSRYTNAMAFEVRCLQRESTYTQADFDRVLDRSMPLAIPLIAGLCVVGRQDLIVDSIGLVRHWVAAAQLFNDLKDARDDVTRGQFTWVARRLGALDGVQAIHAHQVRGGLTQIIDEAKDHMRSAAQLATSAGLPAAAQAAHSRIDALSEWHDGVLRRWFEALLNPSAD